MFRFAFLASAALLLAPSFALAQTLEDRGTPLPSPEASGDMARQGVEVLIENFDKATATPDVRTYGNGGSFGYTFGTGPQNFKVAEAFQIPSDGNGMAMVLGADLHFGVRSVTPDMSTYTVQVWSGTAQNGPQAQLASQTFPINGIQLSNAGPVPTPVRFSAPVPVSGGSFFIVIPFDQSALGDSLAIATTGQRAPEFIPNTWHFRNNGWEMTNTFVNTGGAPLQTWMWIDALIDYTVVSTERLPAGVSSVRLFPNPAPEAGALEIVVEQSADAQVSILDVLGREVASVFSGTLPTGRRTFDLRDTGLTAGTYAVRVVINGVPVTRMLTVTR